MRIHFDSWTVAPIRTPNPDYTEIVNGLVASINGRTYVIVPPSALLIRLHLVLLFLRLRLIQVLFCLLLLLLLLLLNQPIRTMRSSNKMASWPFIDFLQLL